MHSAAVAAFQEDAGLFHLPCKDRSIVLFLKGTQRLYDKPAKPKAAMTQKILIKYIKEALGKDVKGSVLSAECHKWRAAIFELFAYLAMARHSDLAHVETSDVEVFEDRLIVKFHTRKNNRGHKGHSVILLASEDELCPVKLYRKYIRRLSEARGEEYHGFILPSFGKKKGVYFPTKTAASISTIRAVQKKLLVKINIDPKLFGCHSGRRGGATDSAEAGIEYSETAEAGGWAKGSLMPEHYDTMGKERTKIKVALVLRLTQKEKRKSKKK
jgi:integrase